MLVRFDTNPDDHPCVRFIIAVEAPEDDAAPGAVPGALLAPDIPAAVGRWRQIAGLREQPGCAADERDDAEPPVGLPPQGFR